MDVAVKDEVAKAFEEAKECLNNLTTSKEKLSELFANLRMGLEEHVASMEMQTRHKLDEIIEEQTRKVAGAERELRERLGPKKKPSDRDSALKRLTKCSAVSLEFEISPDLDRLRFLSEFGIIRVKEDHQRDRKGKKTVRFCRPNSEPVLKHLAERGGNSSSQERYAHNSQTDNTEDNPEEELTTDSGFLLVSTREPNQRKDAHCAESTKIERFVYTKAEVTSKERDEFVTMEDDRIVTFSKSKGNVMLFNKECRMLSEYKVEHPKSICSSRQNTVLVVKENPSHDQILELKVVGNKLVKVNAIRIKCHDRICDITRKGMSVYVMCSGNHLHILDT